MAASKRNAVVAAAAWCVLVVLAVGAEAQGGGGGGECVPQLNRLLACRAYAGPGAGGPSAECCSALSSISQGCACSAISIMNSLPSRCHLAQVNCC
uniref:Bifunctional inhibitor/plant lipid transfer protein/seed storage helical domain-containing protein n=1 Tax=Oryza brachyantha TaxID=4533 RepID=J3MUZ9_ORYBR